MQVDESVISRHQQRLRTAIEAAKAQEGPDEVEDEPDDEDEDEEDEEGEDGGDPDVGEALAMIERSPKALSRLKVLLGIREDMFRVKECECPQCTYEGDGHRRRAVRLFHWYCFVCWSGPYAWQLHQPLPRPHLYQPGAIAGVAHYLCSTSCQVKYHAMFPKHRAAVTSEGVMSSEVSGVLAR